MKAKRVSDKKYRKDMKIAGAALDNLDIIREYTGIASDTAIIEMAISLTAVFFQRGAVKPQMPEEIAGN